MDDLISRQAAINEVTGLCKECIEYPDGHCGSCLINTEGTTIRGAKKALEDIPSADVRKNIKAQKVIGGGERDGATCWFECSHCHGTMDPQDMFCKHCGAVLEWWDD